MEFIQKRSLILENNLPQTFFKRVATSPHRTAMLRKVSGTWKSITWTDYQIKVVSFAATLLAEGVKKGDRIAILSNSRPEWAWADLGIMALGAVCVPIYPSLMPDDIEYILKDSNVKIVFAEDMSQKLKIESIAKNIPNIKRVILFNSQNFGESEFFVSLEEWLQNINGTNLKISSELIQSIKNLSLELPSTELASIVYTSGTSGVPKGVELTHECFLSLIKGVFQALPIGENDTTLLFLPMAHIMGRIEHLMSLGAGWNNAYAENLKVMMDNLVEVRPTILLSVPRIYEKIYSSILAKINKGILVEKTVGRKAIEFATIYSKAQESSKSLDMFQSLQYKLYSKLLYEKVRHRFGGRLRFCVSGGAPFSSEISRFFHASGVMVLEGYGLTETTGPLCVNRMNKFKLGSVGMPLEGVEIKIAEDGEILAKGSLVTQRYHNLPAATKDAFDENNYFLTGDIGHFDADGFLYITDRKKDLIVTAGGKNIAPQKIESLIIEDSLFSQSIVLGDNQKYLAALVTLNSGEARQLAKSNQIDFGSIESLYEDSKFQKLVFQRIQMLNKKLASFESIKRIKILNRELSVENGEMTPSLKIKRKFCSEKYAEVIKELFV